MTKPDSCTVYSNLDPMIYFRTDYLFCPKNAKAGPLIRKALGRAYDREMRLTDMLESDFWKVLPQMPVDN